MKRTAGIVSSFLLLGMLLLSSSVMAETVTSTLLLSPANENPPIAGLDASGTFQITVNVTRDANGSITSGTVRFLGNAIFPGSVTIVGLHIHEGAATVNGPVVINTGISGASPVVFAGGSGLLDFTVQNANVDVLGRLLKNPAGFYVNLHTTVNTGGAIRGQLVRFEERQVITVDMTPAKEVPPIPNLTASGVGTITASPTRDDKGVVTGGTVTFTITYDFPAGTTLVGLHIHEGAADANGPVVINTGISGANSIALPTGKGSLSINVPLTTAGAIGAMTRMLDNPTGFYVNLHTSVNTGGAIRSQLAALSSAPPILQQSDTYFLETGSSDASIKVLATGIDLTSSIVVNGQPVLALPDLSTGLLTVTIPAAMRANAGILFMQVKNGAGVMSTPIQIIVASSANVNSAAPATVDSAKYGGLVSPDSIASAFGTKLASQMVAATTTPLPTLLDGTTVYVNGEAARLFFVSEGQINFLIPSGVPAGPASVVIVAKDGTVSRGTINVSASSPSIFTRTANGQGAPAAVASTDGQAFNITMANSDGSPVAIDAGNFVMIFGTGFRYASTAMTMTIGGDSVTPLGFAAQSQFAGLDQANVQIPMTMAGKGDVDLVITLDGKASNAVKLKIK